MDFTKLTIEELSNSLQKKEVSSLELCKFFLDRVKKIDPQIKACISVFEKDALDEAKEADKRITSGEKGSLLGIPYLVKDNILTKGKKTTAASKMLEDYTAPYDATVISKLRKAGAVLLGKTNMDEFAHGASTENSAFFVTKNPWDLERVPGGSSGGSAAAVAAGLCVFALGSDTGGSIRQPSSFCGVSGLKPSYSRVSRYGLISMTSSTDVIGPIARNSEDLAIVLKCISGFDNNDLSSSKEEVLDYSKNIKKNIKIAIVLEFLNSLDDEYREVVLNAIDFFKKNGAEIKEVSLNYNKYAVPAYYIITPSEISSNLARLDGIRYGFSCDYKAKGCSAENISEIYSNNRGMSFGEEAKRRVMLGTYALSAGYFDAYYKKAMAVKDLIVDEFDEIFSDCDIILTPTTPKTAFKIGEKLNDPVQMYLEDIFVTAPSFAGLPAASIPVGFVKGLPFGLQIIANRFREDLVLGVAKMFQEKNDFHNKDLNLN
jgi:aspartyl-tRNA(Asn)/glutamyl-tRNA(Gln) amidotransferase subunit A